MDIREGGRDNFPFISRRKSNLLDSPSPNLQAKFTVAKYLFLSKPGCYPCSGSRSFSLLAFKLTHTSPISKSLLLANFHLMDALFFFPFSHELLKRMFSAFHFSTVLSHSTFYSTTSMSSKLLFAKISGDLHAAKSNGQSSHF